MRTKFLLALLLAGCAKAAAPTPPSAPAPRPEVTVDGPVNIDQLLQVVRIRAAMTAATFYKYTFRQTVTDEDLAEDGSLKRSETSVYQVIPSKDGTERHLISHDGEPPSPGQVRKQEHRNDALKRRIEKSRDKAAEAAAKRRAAMEAGRPAPPPPRAPPGTTVSVGAGVQRSGPPPAAAAHPAIAQPAAGQAARVQPTATQPASVQAPATPLAGGGATSTAAAPASVPAPALAPLPPCNLDDPASSLRPPLPGSVTKSMRAPVLGPDSSRRAREKTSDYSLWELLQLTEYEYAGACEIDGRPIHVVTYKPPETFDPLNPVERVMTAMKGTLLIDGSDVQVLRADGTTIAPITWGAGMVKLKSAHVVLEYSKVGGEIWLPSRDLFEFDSRVLFDHMRQRFTHVFDDFQKATVDVETEFEYKDGSASPATPPQ